MTLTGSERIGFLGGGHMGRALIAALLRQGVEAHRIVVGEPDPERRAALAHDLGVEVTADNIALVRAVDLLVLAVKPQDMTAALQPLQDALADRRPLLVSIAAGLTVEQLQRAAGAPLSVVRAMPNRPAMLGLGATGLYAPPDVSATDRARAQALLAAAGMVAWIDDETLMDAVTAVCGSGPAYFFRMGEALAAAGRAQGLPPEVADRLAAATLAGAGAMAAADPDLAALRASVTSRGGTTAAALSRFETDGLAPMVERAVDAAVQRGRALSASSGV